MEHPGVHAIDKWRCRRARAGRAPVNRPEHFDCEWDWLGDHIDTFGGIDDTSPRVGLPVHRGHFERRGLERGLTTDNAQSAGVEATETAEFYRSCRMTVATSGLLRSTAAVLDVARSTGASSGLVEATQ